MSLSLFRAAPKDEDEMMVAIFEYIDRIFNIVRPRRLLYMAIDGVVRVCVYVCVCILMFLVLAYVMHATKVAHTTYVVLTNPQADVF